MTFAKGALAAGVAFALVFDCAHARAIVLARGVVVETGAPVPGISPGTPIAAASLVNSPTASLPLLAPAPVLASLVAAPAARDEERPSGPLASDSLRAMTAPARAFEPGGVYDGRLAANGAEPASDAAARSFAARLAPPAPRGVKSARSTAGRLLTAAVVGAGASAAAPFLWSAMPAEEALRIFAVAVSPVAAAAALVLAARAARAAYRRLRGSVPDRTRALPLRRRTGAIRAFGVALGIVLTAATAFNQRPIIEAADAFADSRRPAQELVVKTEIPGAFFGEETARVLAQSADGRAALAGARGSDGVAHMPSFFVAAPRQRVQALPGAYFADAAARLLSRDAAGRAVLDGLRDRGGVVRMPAFFVSDQKISLAMYKPDAVYLSVKTIEEGGVTVEEFLRGPQAQLRYLERNRAIIVHELAHAGQARRSPVDPDTWTILRTNAARLLAAVKAYESSRPETAPEPARAEASAAAPVSIDGSEIGRSGSTIQNFVNDHQAQKDYIARHQAELSRALRSAPEDASASPAAPSFHMELAGIQENEDEAYLTEHFYTHERLKADPAADIPSAEYANYVHALVGFDDFLRSIDGRGDYPSNVHSESPYYARYMAGMRAHWDEHRVEANVLLARHALAHHDPGTAHGYYEQALRIALEKGLPIPVLALPAR